MPHPQPHIYRQQTLVRLLAIAVAGGSSNAFAIGTLNDQIQTPLIGEFRKLDRNSDTKLSNDEACRDSDIVHRFSKADGNHDGTLSAEEYGKFKSAAQRARLETYLDDSGVTAKVKAELLKDIGTKGLSISVETYQGRVILSGFVDTAQQSRRAVEIASGIRGVHSITNSLLVKKTEGQAAQTPSTPNATAPVLRTAPTNAASARRTYISTLAPAPKSKVA
ncbi:MAG TPA: BON domain-containing protein [Methylophilaceae bacterium]|nr:BON domain-containing protein [Methylophilaceae bacterium]HQR60878.1 BON domain-containing protein [Methylophilaceae bacterium]